MDGFRGSLAAVRSSWGQGCTIVERELARRLFIGRRCNAHASREDEMAENRQERMPSSIRSVRPEICAPNPDRCEQLHSRRRG
jgi:hypothetical protein